MTMSEFNNYLGIFPFVVGLFVLFALARLVRDMQTSFDDNRAMVQGNIAATQARVGYYIGISLAAGGSLIGSGTNYWKDLGYFLADGALAIAYFAVAAFILDRVILPETDNNAELKRDNRAMGVVELFTYPALGAILMASFAGNGTSSYGQGLLSALLFSGLGVAVLLIAYLAYDRYHRMQSGVHDLDDAIRRGDMSAALNVGSTILGLGIVLSFSIAGDFTGWGNDIESFAVAVPFAVAALILCNVLVRLLVPRVQKVNRSSMNLAYSGLRAGMMVTTGVIAGLNII